MTCDETVESNIPRCPDIAFFILKKIGFYLFINPILSYLDIVDIFTEDFEKYIMKE